MIPARMVDVSRQRLMAPRPQESAELSSLEWVRELEAQSATEQIDHAQQAKISGLPAENLVRAATTRCLSFSVSGCAS